MISKDLERLLDEAAQRYARPQQGLCYRSYRLGGDPYFKQTGLAGARFNLPGRSLVYTSLSALTCLAEATEGSRTRGFSPEAKFPQEVHVYRYDFTRVLDLTLPQVVRFTGIRRRDGDLDWFYQQHFSSQVPFTQQVGEALRQTGIEAFIVWSYANRGGRNLNIFPERIREGENWVHLAVPMEPAPSPSKPLRK